VMRTMQMTRALTQAAMLHPSCRRRSRWQCSPRPRAAG
jgi:hypothetical protein